MDGSTAGASKLTLTVNGERQELQVAPWVTLLGLLREELHLTGSKKGCDHGQCGACTVLIDGARINSCLILAVARDGADVTTIEGLAGADLHPIGANFGVDGTNRSAIHEEDGLRNPSPFRHCLA
jgi:xanthine dehydrogenase YagT iron-sulfur-binding subunit